MKQNLDDQAIRRRASFILGEAKAGLRVRDQAVTFAMRVISSYFALGADMSSAGAKRASRRMSREALQLKKSMSAKEWIKQTVNEHQEPLAQTWTWMIENQEALTVDQVLERFSHFPMVTVTKREDQSLRSLRHLAPHDRYLAANIVVLARANNEWAEVMGRKP